MSEKRTYTQKQSENMESMLRSILKLIQFETWVYRDGSHLPEDGIREILDEIEAQPAPVPAGEPQAERVNGEWFALSEQDVFDICSIKSMNFVEVAS